MPGIIEWERCTSVRLHWDLRVQALFCNNLSYCRYIISGDERKLALPFC